jgi:hypothetical protein
MHHPPFGHVEIIGIAAPAVATDWTTTVPAALIWKILSICFDFNTDANVANRSILIDIESGALALGSYLYFGNHTAGVTIVYTASASPTDNYHDAYYHRSMALPPNLWLPGGTTIHSAIANMQVGDQLGNVGMIVEQWIQP